MHKKSGACARSEMERKKARLAPLDECLKLCELLPRLAFRGDVAQLEVVLSWAQRQKGHCAVVEALASTDGAGRTPLVSAVRGQQHLVFGLQSLSLLTHSSLKIFLSLTRRSCNAAHLI